MDRLAENASLPSSSHSNSNGRNGRSQFHLFVLSLPKREKYAYYKNEILLIRKSGTTHKKFIKNRLVKMEIITITKKDPRFPNALKAIGNECPDRIYAIGNIELLKSDNMVAIIGSRKASRRGNNAA